MRDSLLAGTIELMKLEQIYTPVRKGFFFLPGWWHVIDDNFKSAKRNFQIIAAGLTLVLKDCKLTKER